MYISITDGSDDSAYSLRILRKEPSGTGPIQTDGLLRCVFAHPPSCRIPSESVFRSCGISNGNDCCRRHPYKADNRPVLLLRLCIFALLRPQSAAQDTDKSWLGSLPARCHVAAAQSRGHSNAAGHSPSAPLRSVPVVWFGRSFSSFLLPVNLRMILILPVLYSSFCNNVNAQ